jgi:hypothetical protein
MVASRTAVVCFTIALFQTDIASAECGDRGGPGYRGPSGRCVGWADIGRTCGSPPTTRCTAERVSTGSEVAAEHGQKAWDAGKDARKQGGSERLTDFPVLTAMLGLQRNASPF